MHHVLAVAGPATLVHSRAPATGEPWLDLLSIPWPCSPAERLQAACPDRGLARACAPACAADRAELPLEFLRRQNYGCSPLAPPGKLPRRVHRGPVLLLEASDRSGPVRAVSRWRAPSVDLRLLSAARIPVALRQGLAHAWLRGHGRMPLLRVRVHGDYYAVLPYPTLLPSVWRAPVLHKLPRA